MSQVRSDQAAQTQRRILAAAYESFVRDGYTTSTVSAIAASAGVSAQTVYNTFGTKAALLKRAYDVHLVGDEQPISFGDRPEVRAVYAETDPRRFLEGYAHLGRVLLGRLGPLVAAVLAGAHAGDADLKAHVDTTNGERLVGATMIAQRLSDLGALRNGLSVERAADAIWALISFELWDLLRRVRGWDDDELEAWTARALADAVLRDGL